VEVGPRTRKKESFFINTPFPKKTNKKIYFRLNVQINKNFKSFLGKIREKKRGIEMFI
jgi:hypothetical protein